MLRTVNASQKNKIGMLLIKIRLEDASCFGLRYTRQALQPTMDIYDRGLNSVVAILGPSAEVLVCPAFYKPLRLGMKVFGYVVKST